MDLEEVELPEVLGREDCLSLAATVPVGRLGVSIEALPAILPVNFTIVAERIIIRSVPGSKLDAATAHNVVAFEVDRYDADGKWGWSVLVRGLASLIIDSAELEDLQRLQLRAWAFSNDAANRFLSIPMTLVSGRRFGRLPD